MTEQIFMSDIRSQMNPSPRTLWQVILIFTLYVHSNQQEDIKFRQFHIVRYMTSASKLFVSHRFRVCFPFRFHISFKYLPAQSFCLFAGSTCIQFF